MTDEEAIKKLERLYPYVGDEMKECFERAIHALKVNMSLDLLAHKNDPDR